MKRCLRYLKTGSHLFLAISAMASAYLVPLLTICSVWKRNLSFWSKITFRYFASGLRWIVVSLIVTDASTFTDVFRVKCISMYLDF